MIPPSPERPGGEPVFHTGGTIPREAGPVVLPDRRDRLSWQVVLPRRVAPQPQPPINPGGDFGGPLTPNKRAPLDAALDGLDGLGHREAQPLAARGTLTAERARHRLRGGCCG